MSKKDTLRKGVVAGEGKVPSSPPRPSQSSGASSNETERTTSDDPSQHAK